MVRVRKTTWILVLLGGVLSTSAHAEKKVVVPPFVARSTSAEQALSMTTLIASEMELLDEFDVVQQLDSRPSGWNTSCISSRSCLAGISRKHGAQALLGGTVSKRGGEFTIKLVFFSGGQIVRTETIQIPTDPMAVADELSSQVRVVVTGVSPESKKRESMVQGFESGGVGLLDEEEDDEPIVMMAPSVSRRIPTQSSRPSRQLEELEDPDERGGYRPAPVPAPVVQEEVDLDDIQFGSATQDIQVEDVTFGSAANLIEVEEAPPRRRQPPPQTYRDPVPIYEDPIGDSRPVYENLDDPDPQPQPVRQTRSRPARTARPKRQQSRQNSNVGSLGLTGRLGYSNFQVLNFLTYGVEGAFQVQDTLAVVAGLEAYSVRRALPPELVPEGQPAVQWNTILPFNLGMLYKPSTSDIRPYVGAGAQLIPGYVKSIGAMAFGFRARGGVDFILADNFGLNLNAAAGIWSGEHFGEVQEGLKPVGLVPQISGGTIFIF